MENKPWCICDRCISAIKSRGEEDIVDRFDYVIDQQ